ncbi:protease complex subunit PrcB family protein [Maledivibacter halophilus]|uniref:PrcB C-terminal n=1 Tax=Maledivibacter halophilus TaxID=36842 RepID=A0A1T5JHU9_9FIRM|nr:protease complex subunit PrcB family protein [Maledivibacter halophilus]SKC50772.1 PrcB C-terminal [Maledivibacter halophilus]
MENNMNNNMKKPNDSFKRFFNIKSLMILLVVILVLISGTMAIKHFTNDEEKVEFQVLSGKEIPQKLNEILPRYQTLERALACKVNGEIYVVVTRGEKPTGGYSVDIDKIEKMKDEEDKFKLIVYAKFTDPKPGDVVTQAVTYPYVVAKTNLKELPYRIELKTRYEE